MAPKCEFKKHQKVFLFTNFDSFNASMSYFNQFSLMCTMVNYGVNYVVLSTQNINKLFVILCHLISFSIEFNNIFVMI